MNVILLRWSEGGAAILHADAPEHVRARGRHRRPLLQGRQPPGTSPVDQGRTYARYDNFQGRF
jgi:hypothetical protein